MMLSWRSSSARILAAALIGGMIAIGLPNPWSAYAASDDSNRHVERAQTYLSKGELQSAIIELKNAVSADPDNAAARYALGVAFLQIGDPASAESELEAARSRGFDEAKILEPLARSLLLQNQFQKLVDTLVLKDQAPELAAEILSWRGYAFMGLRQEEQAKQSFSEAIRKNPKGSRGYEGLAYLLLRQGNLAAAELQVDAALKIAPTGPDALAIKGELRRLGKDPTGALPYFDKAIKANPNILLARVGRAALNLERDQLDQAQADVNAILKLSPDAIVGPYLQALILARHHDVQAAVNLLMRYGSAVDSYPPALRLLGALYAGQGQLEQAETYLRRFLATNSGDLAASKELGTVLLKKGQPAAAVEILKPAAQAGTPDPQLLGLLAVAYLRNNQVAESGEWFDKAIAAKPDDAATLTKIAAGRLEAGQLDEAAKDLQTAIDLDPKAPEARILLALADVRRKNFDQALAVATALKPTMPGSPMPDNIVGAIKAAKGDVAGARASFEDALKIAPDFLPTQMNLAGLDLAQGQVDAARRRYEAIVDADPTKAVAAMIALADIDLRQGQPDQAETWLLKAQAVDARAIGPQVALIDFYLNQRKFDKANAVALTLQQAGAGNLQAEDAVARSQLAAGDTASAVGTVRRMTAIAPRSPSLQDRLARTLLMAGDEAGARAALKTAMALDDGFLPAQLDMLDLEVRAGRATEAVAQANEWRDRHPGAGGDALVGAVLARAGRYDEAAAAFAAATAKEATSENVVNQYDAMLKAGKAQEAITGMTSWLSQHPDDQLARFALASTLLEVKRSADAKAQYELLMKKIPQNPVVLNNLAWLYAAEGDKRGLDYAEQAHRLAPDSPDIADTLGYILVRQGETERGLKLLTEAHEKAPSSAETTYHLVVALKQAGRTEEARTLLSQLLASAQPFDGRQDAEILQKKFEAQN